MCIRDSTTTTTAITIIITTTTTTTTIIIIIIIIINDVLTLRNAMKDTAHFEKPLLPVTPMMMMMMMTVVMLALLRAEIDSLLVAANYRIIIFSYF